MTSILNAPPNSPIILVGAGHTHLSLLHLAWRKKNRTLLDRIILISEDDYTIYSGMISGWILGEYQLEELCIDLKKTCKKFGVTFLKDSILSIEPNLQKILTKNQKNFSYQILSLNTGLTPPLILPELMTSKQNNLFFIRPLKHFIQELKPVLDHFETISNTFNSIKIYGGGASGVEIASCLSAKAKQNNIPLSIQIIESSPSILPDFSDHFRQQTIETLKLNSIDIFLNASFNFTQLHKLSTDSLHIVCFSLNTPTTETNLQIDPTTHYRNVSEELLSYSYKNIFCVGDAASFTGSPAIRKSGAHAVFQSKTLYYNIQNCIKKNTLKKYPAKKLNDHLLILNLGNRFAILQKSNFILKSPIAWHLKHWIDKKYMNQFEKTSVDMIVSAVALVSGGTYQILLQAIDTCKFFPDKKFVFLVHSKKNLPQYPNLSYIEFPNANRSYFKRLKTEYLDFYPLSQRLNPTVWLSLHDVTPRVKSITQAVYCHNALPYWQPSLFHWRLHRFEVIRSYLYGWLFKFRSSHNDIVISQLPWFAKFLSTYIPLPLQKFVTVRPKLIPPPLKPEQATFQNKIIEKNFHTIRSQYKKILFYPCLPRVFKKIEDASELARLSKNTAIIVSISGNENAYARYCKELAKNLPNVFWWGELNHQDCMDILSASDGLFFPSDLESFGLPLQEAIDRNVWILAPQNPWVVEVVADYPKSYIYKNLKDASHFVNSDFIKLQPSLPTKTKHYPTDAGQHPTPLSSPIPQLEGFEPLFQKLFELSEKKLS